MGTKKMLPQSCRVDYFYDVRRIIDAFKNNQQLRGESLLEQIASGLFKNRQVPKFLEII